MTREQRRRKRQIYKQASEALLKLEVALGDMQQFLIENHDSVAKLNESLRSSTIRSILRKYGNLAPLADAISGFNHMRED